MRSLLIALLLAAPVRAEITVTQNSDSLPGSSACTGSSMNIDGTLVVDCANNRVGVGTASPLSSLHISAPALGSGVIIDGGSNGYEGFRVGVSSLVVVNGNVGIGTASPVAKFHINSIKSDTITGANAAAYFGDTSYGNGIGIQSLAAAPYGSAIQSMNTAGAGQPLALNPSGGNVGIGTTNPGSPLEVKGDIFQVNSSGDPRLILGDSTSAGNYASIQWASASDQLQLGTQTGGTNAIIIDETSGVRIGVPLTVTSSMTAAGIGSSSFIGFASQTKAQLEAITPTAAGQSYYCSDCSNAVHMVVSTGTTLSGFDSFTGGVAWH